MLSNFIFVSIVYYWICENRRPLMHMSQYRTLLLVEFFKIYKSTAFDLLSVYRSVAHSYSKDVNNHE